nr:zinc finger BED domain-containing protein RICESLEEPER 2-like [Ipomoea batatas]
MDDGGGRCMEKRRGPQPRGSARGIVSSKDMLSEFYNTISPGRSILCAGVDVKRMQMAWRDSKNKIDCGVFLMRHMETYLSQGVSNWDCGLVKGDTSDLHKLRMRCMKEFSISKYNIHRSRNLSRAYQSISAPLYP